MVDPREHRIHMYLSREELEAIDTWRFNNRVATRSEAIRRLCQTALSVSESLDTLDTLIQGALDWQEASEQWESSGKISEDTGEENSTPAYRQAQLFTKVSMIAVKTLISDLKLKRNALATAKTLEAAALIVAEGNPEVESAADFLGQFMADWDKRTGGMAFRPKLDAADLDAEIHLEEILPMANIRKAAEDKS